MPPEPGRATGVSFPEVCTKRRRLHVETAIAKGPSGVAAWAARWRFVLLLGFTFFYSQQGGDPNQSPRLALVRALVKLGIVADPEADADPLRRHRLATRWQLGRLDTAEEVVHVVPSLLDANWATGEIWGVGR